jgi:DNA-binding CsgD family transcriptional regulator
MAPTLSSRLQSPLVPAPQPAGPGLGSSPLSPEAWLQLRGLLRLSDRELQIVQGIFAEQEQDSIALALGISPELVYRTTQRIYIKLHIGSRLELKSKVRSAYLTFASTQPEKLFRAG